MRQIGTDRKDGTEFWRYVREEREHPSNTSTKTTLNTMIKEDTAHIHICIDHSTRPFQNEQGKQSCDCKAFCFNLFQR